MTKAHNNSVRRARYAALGFILLPMLAVACGDDESLNADVYPATYYPYTYYYPSDWVYADTYMADDWYVYPYAEAAGGASSTSAVPAGGVLRALAQGEDVCGDGATLKKKTAEVDCTANGKPGEIQTGAEVKFSNCTLASGVTLDGSIDVDSTRSFSEDTCDAQTATNVDFTGTFKDLTYTAADGSSLVIPNMVSSGTYTRLITGQPPGLTMSVDGMFERYDASGSLIMQAKLSGTQNVTLAGQDDATSYLTDGTMVIEDQLNSVTVTIVGREVKREEGCCHPTSGTLEISAPDQETQEVAFSSECGSATLNGDFVTLPACQ